MVRDVFLIGLGEHGSRQRQLEWRYGMAAVVAGLAVLVRFALEPWLRGHQPWVTLYLAVPLVAWWLGFGPAILTAVLGLVGGLWFLIPPGHFVALTRIGPGVQVLTYCAVASAIILLMRTMRRDKERAREATEILRQQELEYHASFELAVLGEGLLDPATGQFLRANEALVRMLGYGKEELMQMRLAEILHSQDRESELLKFEGLANAKGGESGYVSEVRFVPKDGLPIRVRLSASLGRGPGGRPWRVMAVMEDVTARREAERALRSEKALSQAVIDSLPGLFFLIDEEMRLRTWNKNFERLSGYSGEEICRMTAMDLSAPEDRQLVQNKIREAFTKGEAETELYSLTKDGRRLPYACIGKKLSFGTEQEVIGLGVDISHQKQVEKALKEQNERQRLLNEAAAYLLSSDDSEEILCNLYHRIAQFLNAGVFLAFRANEANGILELETCGGVTAGVRKELAQLRFGEGICGTVAQQRQPLVVSHIQESDEPIAELAKGLGLRVYACNPLLAEGRLLGTLAFASAQRDVFEPHELEFFHTLASYVAIAKERVRLHNELRQRARHLEQTVAERTASLREMMSELEHFSYSIVHDMRAPLRSVLTFAELIARECGPSFPPKAKEYLQRLRESIDRMDQLITDALQYSWAIRSELPLTEVDVAALLHSMLETYPEFLEHEADIRLEGEIPPVRGNAAGLTQCFSNLLSNAVKFVHPGQRPEVRIWAEQREGVVRLWFEDKGIGIPSEGRQRIFDMFQRMHSSYEGTGIGLALVRKVVQRMGGSLGVESEPGQGSRFWIELPKVN